MQEIISGVTDQYVYFYAVDPSDHVTPVTGLGASFVVYRSRNGGAAAAMTTPTINETDATNMPGLYELLLDEDTTLDAGDHSQNMALHISHETSAVADMDPAIVAVKIVRPDVTAGRTLSIDADGDMPWNADWDAEVQSECNDAIVANHLDHLLAADYDPSSKPGNAGALLNELVEGISGVVAFTEDALQNAPAGSGATAQEVWEYGTRVLTAGTNIQLPSDGLDNVTAWTVDITGSLSGAVGSVTGNVSGSIGSLATQAKADVNAEADTAIADAALATAANLATVDNVADAIKAKTDQMVFGVANTLNVNITYVNEVAVGGTGASGDEWGPA